MYIKKYGWSVERRFREVLDRINKINRIMGNVGSILNLVNPV